MEKGSEIWWYTLCGNHSSYDAFWSNDLTLYTNRPSFTSCFQDTVLTWIPLTILFLLTLHEIPSLRNLPIVHSSWHSISAFCYFKTILCIGMSLLSSSRLLHGLILRFSFGDLQMTNASFLAHSINTIAQVAAAYLTWMTFCRGRHTSSVLFFYWFLSVLSGILIFVSQVNYIYSNEHLTSSEVFQLSASFVMLFFVCVQFLAACVADTAAFGLRQRSIPDEKTPLLGNNYKHTEQESKSKNPQESASFLSSAFFWWFNWIVAKGFKTPLKYSDIWELSPENSTKVVVPKFEAEWKENVTQYEKGKKTGSAKRKPSFVMAIIRTYGAFFMTGFFLMLFQSLLVVANPFILDYFIQFIQERDSPYAWHGYILAFAMFFCTSVSILFLHNAFYIGYTTGMRLRTVVITNVYRKMLRLSCTARKECSGGAVVNLMSVDAQKIQECFNWTHYTMTCPIEVGVALAILWSKIGVSSLVGFVVLLMVVPVNSIYIGHRIRSAQVGGLLTVYIAKVKNIFYIMTIWMVGFLEKAIALVQIHL